MRCQCILLVFALLISFASLWAVELADTLLVEQYREQATACNRAGKRDSSEIYLRKALALNRECLSTFDTPSRWADYVNCMAALGYLHLLRSEFEAAETTLTTALELGIQNLGRVHYENSNTLNNLGIYYKTLRDYENALSCFERSFNIFVQVKGSEHRIVGHLYNNMGVVSDAFGDYDRALGYFKKALHRFRTGYGETYSRIGMVYRNLGLVQLEKKEYALAIEYFKKSILFFQTHENGSLRDELKGLVCLGKAYAQQKEYDLALQHLNQALKVNKTFDRPDQKETRRIYAKLGRIYLEQEEWQRATYYFKQAIRLAHDIWGEGVELATGYYDLADLYFRQQHFSKAVQRVQLSLRYCTDGSVQDSTGFSDLPSSHHDLTRLKCLDLKARILEARYDTPPSSIRDLKTSYSCWQTAIRVLDTLRSRMDFDSQLFLNSSLGDRIFRRAVSTAWTLYQLTGSETYLYSAYYWNEKAKANILFALMNQSRAKSYAGIPDSLLTAERRLESLIAFWQRKRAEASSPEQLDESDRHIFEYKSRIDTLTQQFESYNPDYYHLKYQTEPIPLNAVQSTLDEKTAFLHLFFTGSEIILFLITQTDIHAVNQPVDHAFQNRVSDFATSIRTLDTQATVKLGRRLYKELFEPIRSRIGGIEALVVIPHDILFRIPFEALICSDPHTPFPRFSEVDFLIRHLAISYHYSSSLYCLTRRSALEEKNRHFVGMAPVLGPLPRSSTPFAVREQATPGGAAEQNQYPLSPLPHSPEEISDIAAILRDRDMETTCLTDRDATEQAFKSNCQNVHTLHIASHGLIDHNHPESSAIAFYPSDDPDSQEDGLLYSGETYNLDLDAELVVLSCCESGVGKLIKGEGLIALTRGFLYSGARNIVVSLWRLADKQTREFMPLFYHGMEKEGSFADALRQAKLQCLQQERTAFPYLWSGMILIGR
jgi:CHAT domain-containing protein/Tfp pilus assembly protein PilF